MVQSEQPSVKPDRRTALRRRLKWWQTALVLVAVAAPITYHVYLHRPIDSGPAGPHVPADRFNRTWVTRPVLLLGVGDSITAGFGVRRGYSYFDRLVSNPRGDSEDMLGKTLSAVFPDLTVKNISASGTTSIQHLRKQVAHMDKQPDDVLGVVAMTTGGNDIIHNYGLTPPREFAMYGSSLAQAQKWIANYEKRLDEMVGRVEAAFPGGCHIFLANIYDPTDGTGDMGLSGLPAWPDGLSVLEAYNDIIARCCEKHDFAHLVNIHEPFLGHGIHCTKFWLKHYRTGAPHYWYSIIEDPNEQGYDAVRRLFLLEMIKVFAQGKVDSTTGDIKS